MKNILEQAADLGGVLTYERDPQRIVMTMKNGSSYTYQPTERLPYDQLLSLAIPVVFEWAKGQKKDT